MNALLGAAVGLLTVGVVAAASFAGSSDGAADSDAATAVAVSDAAPGSDAAHPPPPLDEWLATHERIGVTDNNGEIRGTVAREHLGAEPLLQPAPVLNDEGEVVGYYVAWAGFVEREVVESPEFNHDEFVAEARRADQAEIITSRDQATARGLGPDAGR